MHGLLMTLALAAQTPQTSQALRDAQALYAAKKWDDAAAAYEQIVATDKSDPRPRAGLAAALYALGEFQRALPVSLDAARLVDDPMTQLDYPGLPPGAVFLRTARIYNRLGQIDKAFEWLDKAMNYPIPMVASLDTEADMANLRADARWARFSSTVRAKVDPCNSRPEYRQFDFWVGDWDVLGGAGQKVGSSHVERILNNCVVFETYSGLPGSSIQANYVGQAFHFFDQSSNKWVQHYVDTVAVPFDWTGEFKDGALRYTREGPFGPKNTLIKQRMTFTPLPDGKVHQLFEQSVDGTAWRAGFNGTYVKRGTASPQ